MNTKRVVMLLAVLTLTSPLGAQMGMGMRAPDLSGIWHPLVGSGGAYEVTDKEGKKSQMEMTIVAKEDVNGKAAYWMEMVVPDPHSGGNMYVKQLIAPGDNGVTSIRMVMQQPGQDPMEMDMSLNMGGRRMPQSGPSAPSDIRDKAEVVGTETISVPAGTFTCQHYRSKDGSADAWVSDKVAPWGLVKTQGKNNTSMILTKVITDAKDHITGTPKKFDPMQMMRDAGKQGQ
jgi:hypothetical protein